MRAKEAILGRVRAALGRSEASSAPSPPPVWLRFAETSVADRIDSFCLALELLSGKTFVAGSAGQARDYVESVVDGRSFVMSNSPFLRTCGFIPPVVKDHRQACSVAHFGITSAQYALADTGSLVMFSGTEEARLLSLLPPTHIAVIPRDCILTGLDELLVKVPLPGHLASAMVIITGPSRTGDIEQILVRGVHGPGEVHVVIV